VQEDLKVEPQNTPDFQAHACHMTKTHRRLYRALNRFLMLNGESAVVSHFQKQSIICQIGCMHNFETGRL